jgi:hypothetical protein
MYYIRYRISGSQLLAAMDLSSSVPHSELLSARAGETSPILDKQDHISPLYQGKEAISRLDERNGHAQQTVDVAEILRRWTHALQRIHKQSLHLVRYFLLLDFLGCDANCCIFGLVCNSECIAGITINEFFFVYPNNSMSKL